MTQIQYLSNGWTARRRFSDGWRDESSKASIRRRRFRRRRIHTCFAQRSQSKKVSNGTFVGAPSRRFLTITIWSTFDKRSRSISKPDFLFPSLELYREAPESGDQRLTMLGAKSTCKDRWRQVLPEAAKIPHKSVYTRTGYIGRSDRSNAVGRRVVGPPPNPLLKSWFASR